MAARLKTIYRDKLVPELKAKLGLKNTMQVPRILKITVNMGVGEAVADKKVMDAATADMAKITGQKPAVTKAKKSVATFKVRDGQAIGCKVTRRPRKLQLGRQRADHFPRDSIRPDRSNSWHGYNHLHVGRGRQARARAAGSLQFSVP